LQPDGSIAVLAVDARQPDKKLRLVLDASEVAAAGNGDASTLRAGCSRVFDCLRVHEGELVYTPGEQRCLWLWLWLCVCVCVCVCV
ncbi:MAG: hypothetical protein P4L40_00045, partial [Terracidiphilus sp.]|nr:hypothetical protein [Terracidiphilus sp.]